MTTREASVEIITTVPQKFWLAKTFVLWDLEDCPVPPDLTAASVYCNILSAIGNMGYIGSFYLHAYSLKNEPEFVQGLEQAFGFKLEYTKIKIFRPESIRAKREHIVGDIYEWQLSNRNEPTNILLISGEILDCNQYVGALQLSIDYNGNVLLALPRDPSESVIGVSRSIWLWSSLSKGGDPLIEETKSLEVVNTLSTPPRTEPPLLCLNCYKKPIDTTEPVCQQTSILDKFSSAEVGVLWDLDVCPIPCGLTPGRIYPNIKTALRNMGYYVIRSRLTHNLYANKPAAFRTNFPASWDLDVCPIPCGLTPAWIYSNIKTALHNMGYYGKVYVSALEKLVNIEEFKSARINLVQPENGRAKRDNMITDVYMWGINHRLAPTNLMPIKWREPSKLAQWTMSFLKVDAFRLKGLNRDRQPPAGIRITLSKAWKLEGRKFCFRCGALTQAESECNEAQQIQPMFEELPNPYQIVPQEEGSKP
ncbi:unnamed protein product [Arabis nemorensis]|uniref:NYN domain-containing protein n=1 Tax=Arabis nemorensis TaxID=586526 RepID=A0A565CP67_9BRAS|nr:unnamed protein product [Arabis nemorensis]